MKKVLPRLFVFLMINILVTSCVNYNKIQKVNRRKAPKQELIVQDQERSSPVVTSINKGYKEVTKEEVEPVPNVDLYCDLIILKDGSRISAEVINVKKEKVIYSACGDEGKTDTYFNATEIDTIIYAKSQDQFKSEFEQTKKAEGSGNLTEKEKRQINQKYAELRKPKAWESENRSDSSIEALTRYKKAMQFGRWAFYALLMTLALIALAVVLSISPFITALIGFFAGLGGPVLLYLLALFQIITSAFFSRIHKLTRPENDKSGDKLRKKTWAWIVFGSLFSLILFPIILIIAISTSRSARKKNYSRKS